MKNFTYVLITPVRNEQATIGITIESVIAQTVRPIEWVIVSDESTDKTDEIVRKYAAEYDFIRLLRLTRRPDRNFASVVFAVESGLTVIKARDYQFIGLLDGDIRFPKNYYEEMLQRFADDPELGLAGGLVVDFYEGRYHPSPQSLKEVAGAVQFFRRECFEALGGLVAVPEGGWDTITCVQARMHGFKTQTFSEIVVDHLKPRNISEGNLVRRTWLMGVREYALGNHPLFEMAKCAYRCVERPYFLASFLRFAGYTWCCLSRRKRNVPAELVRFIRREQMQRLFKRGH
ncbi:MAG: glycosyltransferase family 2 protein [Verrucomicrobiae bacterium]|nr:glycosyltransferase family 2 protein [Verrucomicrobiae bacterium]